MFIYTIHLLERSSLKALWLIVHSKQGLASSQSSKSPPVKLLYCPSYPSTSTCLVHHHHHLILILHFMPPFHNFFHQPLHLPSLLNHAVKCSKKWSHLPLLLHHNLQICSSPLVTHYLLVSILNSAIPPLNYIHLLNFCFGSSIDAMLITCASMAPFASRSLALSPLTSVM